MNKMTFRIEIG